MTSWLPPAAAAEASGGAALPSHFCCGIIQNAKAASNRIVRRDPVDTAGCTGMNRDCDNSMVVAMLAGMGVQEVATQKE